MIWTILRRMETSARFPPPLRIGALLALRRVVVMGALIVSVGFLFSAPVNAQSSDSTFTVDSTADDADAVGDGICATTAGACTLRAAIVEANKRPGPDTIAFGLPGDGIQTIQLTSELPPLTDPNGPTTIDGYTQPGSSVNTDSLVSKAVIKVEIKGAGNNPPASGGFSGLTIKSPGNTVRGLAFYNLYRSVQLFGSDARDNHVAGNFIGTDAAGAYSAPRQVQYSNGIELFGGATRNTIGGASAAERNVISGNAFHGITFQHPGTDSNVVAGNLIGLDPTGSKRLSNHAHGVDINSGASHNVVGGASPEERNVISGNTTNGVEVSHPEKTQPDNPVPTKNQVIGNFIGTDVTGELASGYSYNGSRGINLEDGAKSTVVRENVVGNNRDNGILIANPNTTDNQVYDNRIGVSRGGAAIPNGHSDSSGASDAGVAIEKGANGSRIGPGNIIANNPTGVRIGNAASNAESDSNTITSNSIYNNTGLGIDLDPLRIVNENDPGDLDIGSNTLQNFPVLSSAKTGRRSTTIKGTLESTQNGTFTIQFFKNPNSTKDEGKIFIGETVVTDTDGDGIISFTFKPAQKVKAGLFVTATATNDATGDTSEFSLNRRVSS